MAFEILLLVVPVFVLLWLLWFILLTDSDLVLALVEKFGRPISAYRGKVVWITGASAGLGEAMAYELARVGARLILSARNESLLQEVKNRCLEITEERLTSEDILVLPLDVTKYDQHKSCVKEVLDHFGKIDVLVNNAARYQIGPILRTDHTVEKEIFEVNFFGAINLTKAVLTHFTERRKGQFVVISSMAGKMGVPSCASYSATKFALHGYYETLGMQHAADNVRVTIVCPGIFQSSMYSRAIFTEKNHCEDKNYVCNQMTSERCAYLTLIAAVNKLPEAWVAYQPYLLMIWFAQYLPDFNRRFMMSVIYNTRRVKELNEGIWPKDLPTWQPFFH